MIVVLRSFIAMASRPSTGVAFALPLPDGLLGRCCHSYCFVRLFPELDHLNSQCCASLWTVNVCLPRLDSRLEKSAFRTVSRLGGDSPTSDWPLVHLFLLRLFHSRRLLKQNTYVDL